MLAPEAFVASASEVNLAGPRANRIWRLRPPKIAGKCRPTAILLLPLFCAVRPAAAATYYISPTGSDSNSGLEASQPKKTWRAFFKPSPVLRPGDTLHGDGWHLRTGEQRSAQARCSQTANDGKPDKPITIAAEHERQAWIRGDGGAQTALFRGCSYYALVGLHMSGADNPAFRKSSGILEISGGPEKHVSGWQVRRCLLDHSNRHGNIHLFQLAFADKSVIEENECYLYHRDCILAFQSDSDEFRRNYGNSRLYPDLPPGKDTRGDETFACYPCSNSVFENNISENDGDGYTINALGKAVDNIYLGNVTLNDDQGIRPNARGDTLALMPQNTQIKDFVAIGVATGVYNRSSKNTTCRHCSIFPAAGALFGFEADTYTTGHRGDSASSFLYQDSFSKALGPGAGRRPDREPGAEWNADRDGGSRLGGRPWHRVFAVEKRGRPDDPRQ